MTDPVAHARLLVRAQYKCWPSLLDCSEMRVARDPTVNDSFLVVRGVCRQSCSLSWSQLHRVRLNGSDWCLRDASTHHSFSKS